MAALLLGPPPDARAQADSLAGPGAVAAPADSGAGVASDAPAPSEFVVQPQVRTVPIGQRRRFEQPRWVMLRSLALPGWGQAHNRAWIKAAGVAVAELALIKAVANDERELVHLSRAVDEAQLAGDELAFDLAVSKYNERLADTTSRRWFLGGLIAYALVDAYVDAHFTHFDVEFGDDPALKGGRAPGSIGRVSLRWTF